MNIYFCYFNNLRYYYIRCTFQIPLCNIQYYVNILIKTCLSLDIKFKNNSHIIHKNIIF